MGADVVSPWSVPGVMYEEYADQRLNLTDARTVALVDHHDIDGVSNSDDDRIVRLLATPATVPPGVGPNAVRAFRDYAAAERRADCRTSPRDVRRFVHSSRCQANQTPTRGRVLRRLRLSRVRRRSRPCRDATPATRAASHHERHRRERAGKRVRQCGRDERTGSRPRHRRPTG